MIAAPPARSRFFERIVAFAILCAMLAGCSGGGDKPPRDTLVYLITSDANTLNPFDLNTEPDQVDASFIYDSLAEFGPNLSLVPGLATKWSPSRDGLHWTVELRGGVRWSDGAPFDSRDVVFTWKNVLDPKVGDPYQGQFDFLKDVVALGSHTVRYDLSRPYGPFVYLALQSQLIAPEHLLRGLAPSELLQSQVAQTVSLGPYKLKRWDRDVEMDLVANDTYWRGAPKIPKMAVKIVTNSDQAAEAMRGGEADLLFGVSGSLQRALQRENADVRYATTPGLYERFVLVNHRVKALQDLAVRRAMNYAWDREDVVHHLFHDGDRIDSSVIVLALADYHYPKKEGYPYDPALARKILDDAGWRVGPDGIRRKNGVELRFSLSLPNGGVGPLAMAVFQSDCADVGIHIDLQLLDYPTFIDRTNNFEYQLAYTGWGGSPDPDQYSFMDSKQDAPVGNNSTGYHDAAIDRDLVLGRAGTTVAQRRSFYDDLQVRSDAAAFIVFGYDDYSIDVLSPRLDVHGSHEPDEIFFWNLYDWTLRA